MHSHVEPTQVILISLPLLRIDISFNLYQNTFIIHHISTSESSDLTSSQQLGPPSS